jgi:hypothetical protein
MQHFFLSQEASLLGAVASTSTKHTQIFIDARSSKIYTAEVFFAYCRFNIFVR